MTDHPTAPRPSRLEELGPREREDHQPRVPHMGDEVVDRIQQSVVGPMHVLEHEQDRLPLGEMLHEHPHREQQVDRLAGRGVEAETEEQAEVPGRLGDFCRREQLVEGVTQLRARDLDGVALVDAGDVSHHLAGGAIGRLLLVREAPAPERAASGSLDPLGRLTSHPRLPDPGRPEDRHHVGASVLDGSAPDAGEEIELPLPAGERRVRGGPAPRCLERFEDRPRGDRSRLPLRVDGGDGVEPERVARESVRLLADEYAAGRRGVLQTGGRVHDVAGREWLPRSGLHGDHGLAGADGTAHLEVEPPVGGVQFLDPLQDRETGPDGSFRVVDTSERRTEHGHDRVPDVLLDDPAVALDPFARVREVELVAVADVLWVGAVGARCRAHHVDEQDRDELALLLSCAARELVAARGAEPSAVGGFRAAATAGHGGGIVDEVASGASLPAARGALRCARLGSDQEDA